MKLIQAYRHGQSGGEILVTINGNPLGLPVLRKHETRHSPTRFQFGYGGSGPAELARAILIALFPGNDTVRHPACYQDFKWDKIAPVTGPLLELTSAEIEEWYNTWKATPRGMDTVAWVEQERRLDAELVELERLEAEELHKEACQ